MKQAEQTEGTRLSDLAERKFGVVNGYAGNNHRAALRAQIVCPRRQID
jgi:hypothetical protein